MVARPTQSIFHTFGNVSIKGWPSVVALVVANLIPAIGVVAGGWDAAVIVLLYWTENLVTGAYHILRILTLQVKQPIEHLAKLPAAAFFTLHFGGFCGVHGMFLLAFFGLGDVGDIMTPDHAWPCFLVFIQILIGVVQQLWNNLPAGMEWLILALVASHGVSFVQHHLIGGEYRTLTMDKLMRRPYRRIVILHVAIIFAGMPVMLLGSPMPILVLLVLLKTGMDLWLHVKAHRPTATANQEGK